MAKALSICIEVPEETTESTIRLVEQKAREFVVLFLQQQGDLSIREAAMELNLTYEGYLDLLAERGLPATSDDVSPAVIEAFERWLRQQVAPTS